MATKENYQDRYDALNAAKKNIEKDIKDLKAKAKKDGFTFQGGEFIKDELVPALYYKAAYMKDYVGERGALYDGEVFCKELTPRDITVFKEIRDEWRRLGEPEDFMNSMYEWMDDTYDPDDMTIIDSTYVYSDWKHAFDEMGVTHEDLDAKHGLMFEFDPGKNVPSAGGEVHENSIIQIKWMKRSEIKAVKRRTIDNEFDIWL